MVRMKSWSGKSSSRRDYINTDKDSVGIHVQCYGSSWGLGKYAIAPSPYGSSMEKKQDYYTKCVELLPELQKDFDRKTKSFPEGYADTFVGYFDLGRLNARELSIFKKSVQTFLEGYAKQRSEEITAHELAKKAKKREYVRNRDRQIKEGTIKVGEKTTVEKPAEKVIKKNEPSKGYNVVSSSEELMRLLKERREENRREKERRERRDAGIKAHFDALAKKEQEEQTKQEDVMTK